MKTLREVLEPFAGRELTTEVFTRMREVVEEWGEETGNCVYPIKVEPIGGEEPKSGSETFNVTFEYTPR